MIAEFTVTCPECSGEMLYRALIGEGLQEERTTCGACGADLVVVSNFPAPDTAPFADRFQP